MFEAMLRHNLFCDSSKIMWNVFTYQISGLRKVRKSVQNLCLCIKKCLTGKFRIKNI